MINFIKSQPAPACLVVEKAKNNGDYKCGDVLERLNVDFYKKCYICEDKELTSINVEHFEAHEGDLDLKFDWNNLFLACSHCNNTKSNIFKDLLNCIKSTPIITECIGFKIDGFPKSKPSFKSLLQNDVNVDNTILLLDAVYNGTTPLKKIESSNLRDRLGKEMKVFNDLLHQYFYDDGLNEDEKENLKVQIRRKLSPQSPFTAFKIDAIKANEVMFDEFKGLLPTFS